MVVEIAEQIPILPVTVYTVVEAGFKFCEPPVKFPGFHVYEEAPLAVNKVELPEQIPPFGTLIVGVVFTVILIVAEFEQVPILPVTVYSVVDSGFKFCEPPVKLPGFQT